MPLLQKRADLEVFIYDIQDLFLTHTFKLGDVRLAIFETLCGAQYVYMYTYKTKLSLV